MRRALVTAALTVIALGLAPAPASAQEKSYHFPRVEIDATVTHDGSLHLVEERTFDFRGDFSFAFFTIESTHAPPENIVDFTVTEDGQPLHVVPEVEFDGFKATWYFEASDELKTFRISYTVRCAVDVYDDAAHLLWQFIGTGWTEMTDVARVTVHLPEAAQSPAERPLSCPGLEEPPPVRQTRPLEPGETRAWGHGPLNGVVGISDPQTVVLSVTDLHPATFVEGSILFPAEAVPRMAAIPGGLGRARILQEEGALAEEANALRERHELETLLVNVLYGVLPLVFILLVVISRRRDRIAGAPEMLQEPPEPDLHPAELAMIWGAYAKGVGTKAAYRAQFLHLARTGALSVSAVGRVTEPEDLELRLKESPRDDLDEKFMGFLLPAGGDEPVLLKTVNTEGKRKAKLRSWWTALESRTKSETRKIIRGRSRWEKTAARFLGIGGALYGYHRWTGFGEEAGFVGTPALWLIPISIVGWLVAGAWMRSRPRANALRKRLAEWAAFRRFLTEFPALGDAPALAVIIWEHYLVWAVAMGVADEVEKQVRALVPEDQLPSPWPGGPRGLGSYYWVHRAHSQRVYTPASVAVRSSSSWSSGFGSSSSSGGFGGGFSGGGGGGGGGTGGGAG